MYKKGRVKIGKMALFKKKSKAIVPEPPVMQAYPEADEIKESIQNAPVESGGDGLPELPEMPELPEGEESAEDIVGEVEEEEEAEEPRSKVKGRLTQELGHKQSLPKREKPAARELKLPSRDRDSEKKALFIKIDKFKEILASIEVIGKRISEVEDVISKLKEIKSREDALMDNWQQEIEDLKSKIESIEKNLSEKVE